MDLVGVHPARLSYVLWPCTSRARGGEGRVVQARKGPVPVVGGAGGGSMRAERAQKGSREDLLGRNRSSLSSKHGGDKPSGSLAVGAFRGQVAALRRLAWHAAE